MKAFKIEEGLFILYKDETGEIIGKVYKQDIDNNIESIDKQIESLEPSLTQEELAAIAIKRFADTNTRNRDYLEKRKGELVKISETIEKTEKESQDILAAKESQDISIDTKEYGV